MLPVVVSLVEWLAEHRPRLFLFGGVFLVGHAAIRGLEALTSIVPPPDVFAPVGYLLVTLALVGFYPGLAAERTVLARIAGAVAVLPLVGWLLIVFQSIGELAGLVASNATVLPRAFMFVHLLAFIALYVLFGSAIVVTGKPSRRVGGLVLLPAGLFVAMIAGAQLFGNVAIGSFVIGSGLALVHLSLGIALGALRAETVRDSTAREAPAR